MVLRLTVAVVSILLALVVVGPAEAILRSGNLVRNGGFEKGAASADGRTIVAIPHWAPEPAPTACPYPPGETGATQRGFTVVTYGAPPHPPNSGSEPSSGSFPAAAAGGARNLLFGGPCYGGIWLRQVVDLRPWAGTIASRDMYGVISARLAVAPGTPRQLHVSVRFLDARGRGTTEGGVGIDAASDPPVMRRRIAPIWLHRTRITKAIVEVSLSGPSRAYWMDAFVDDVRLEISDRSRIVPAGGEPRPASPAPVLRIRPSTVALGGKAVISGARWPARSAVQVTLSKQGTALRSSKVTRASATGTFALGVRMTGEELRGRWRVVATSGGRRAHGWLTVR